MTKFSHYKSKTKLQILAGFISHVRGVQASKYSELLTVPAHCFHPNLKASELSWVSVQNWVFLHMISNRCGNVSFPRSSCRAHIWSHQCCTVAIGELHPADTTCKSPLLVETRENPEWVLISAVGIMSPPLGSPRHRG